MRKLLSVFIVFSILPLDSCHKGGCKDSNALNYNSASKYDDGSCRYFSDNLLGTYLYFDSIRQPRIDSSVHFWSSTFQIKRKSGNNVTLVSFLPPTNEIYNVILDSNYIDVEANMSNTDSMKSTYLGTLNSASVQMRFRNDTVFYTALFYNYVHDSIVFPEKHWGYAVKQ